MRARETSALAERVRLYAIHGVARVALRWSSPVRAARVVRTLGKWLPPIDRDAACSAVARLDDRGRGTCLTRALAIAARVPGARVAIGVEPPLMHARGIAHAWVETEEGPLRANDPRGAVIATL